MKTVAFDDLCIRYFGKWQERENHFQTATAYSKVYFNFFGKHVKAYALQGKDHGICRIFLDGRYQGSVDCRSEHLLEACIFEKADVDGEMIHNLMIELLPGDAQRSTGILSVTGFAAEQPVHYPAYLKKEMNRELALIEGNQKPWKPASDWKPVERKAVLPLHNVKLTEGLVRDLFDLNIANLEYNADLEWYSEGQNMCSWLVGNPNITQEELDRPGWAGWAPGQIEGSELGGAAGVLRWEEHPKLRKVAEEIVVKMKSRQRADGYYNYYPEEASFGVKCFPQDYQGREMPKDYFNNYPGRDPLTERKNADRSFWTRGMVEAVNAQIPGAPEVLRGMYDWFNRQEKYLVHMRRGFNATNGDVGGPMVYHTPIGKPEDIITNERYYDQDYWMKAFAQRQPMAMSHYPGERPHSTALLCVQAMADMYIATGDRKYLDAVLGCWDVYSRYYRHPGGLPAIIEMDLPHPPGVYEIYKRSEEACGHINWMWINERLMQLFPKEEKYAAEIEECIYNTLMNSVKPRENVYHILLHGKKEKGRNMNSCCQISAQIAVSSLPQYIYSYNQKELYVNLFIASRYDSDLGTITLDTDFPYSGKVKLLVNPKEEGKVFTVNLRIPHWAQMEVTIHVNGEPAGTGQPGTYFGLNRLWRGNDVVSFELPIGLDAVLYRGVDRAEGDLPRYTFMYGPLLMALQAKECTDSTVVPRICQNVETLLQELRPDPDNEKGLHFPVPGTEYCIMPYWDAPQEGFTCLPVVAE